MNLVAKGKDFIPELKPVNDNRKEAFSDIKPFTESKVSKSYLIEIKNWLGEIGYINCVYVEHEEDYIQSKAELLESDLNVDGWYDIFDLDPKFAMPFVDIINIFEIIYE